MNGWAFMDKLKSHLASAQNIREGEQRFRALVEGIALVVWETDASGVVVDSPNWQSVTGCISNCPDSCWLHAVHPDDREAVERQWQCCLHDKVVFTAEFRLRCCLRQWCWTQAHLVPVADAQGRVFKWIGMNLDISERKAAEQKLMKSERQLHLALDIGRMSFWSFDPRSLLVRMDTRMQVIWGETAGTSLLPLEVVLSRIHPQDRPLVRDSVYAALEPAGTGVYLPTDYRIVLDDGSVRWLAANGMTMFEGRGAERHAVELFGTVLDITERKLTEDSLRESEERLQQLNSELEDRVHARTQELLASEQRLRAAVELAEQGNRQLRRLALELSRTEERERRRLAHILHDHVQQLLVAAKMRIEALSRETVQQETQERLVGVVTVLDMAIDATRSLAVELIPPVLHSQGLPTALHWLASHVHEQNGLLIEADIDPGANPVIEENRDLLFQAAREFLLNVVKHANVTCAKLRLGLDSTSVVLEVRDEGLGFDPQLTDGEEPTFGLFHLRERLTAVGGELHIDSQPRSGTRVTVRVAR